MENKVLRGRDLEEAADVCAWRPWFHHRYHT
jgi:hypothetical protein